jgi:energy-coupling factor transport system permease protein
MSESFSIFVARQSGLHRLHPLTKLALAGFSLVAGMTLPGVWATYVAFGAILLPLAVWGNVLGAFVRAVWRVVLPFAISLLLVQGLFWTGGTPLVGLGPLSLKLEGVTFAARSTGRILMIVSGFLLLALSTRPDALMIALTQRGMPQGIAYIVLTTLQIVPRFQAKANGILDAQRSRGLETEGNIARRLRALLPLVVPLVLGSIVDIEERAIALEARAFSRQGQKTSLLVLTDSPIQAVVRWSLVLGIAILVAARLAAWLLT